MSRLIHFIIAVLLMLAFGRQAAAQQLSLVPVEGSIHSYSCNGIDEGSSYQFYIVDMSGNQAAGYDYIGVNSGIVGNNGIANLTVHWKEGAAQTRYTLWLEVAKDGCSNQINLAVSPQPNNRSAGFDAVASTDCFNPLGNNFEISFITRNNNGQPVEAAHFPLQVDYTVNGKSFTKQLEFDQPVLVINESMFTAGSDQNTTVLIEITGVIDKFGAKLPVDENRKTHYRTVFAVPVIEFSEAMDNRSLKTGTAVKNGMINNINR